MAKLERYRRGSSPVIDKPAVTVQMRGNLSLNKAAYDALGRPEHVALLYDREERIIGLEPVTATDPDAYTCRKQQNSASYLVAGTAFMTFYDIAIGDTRRYSATVIDNQLLIDLKTGGQLVTAGRARRKPDAMQMTMDA